MACEFYLRFLKFHAMGKKECTTRHPHSVPHQWQPQVMDLFWKPPGIMSQEPQ